MPINASTEYNVYWLKHAIESIKKDYGDIVSIDAKRKDLFKFGRIEGLSSTEQTIQFGGGVFDPPAGNPALKKPAGWSRRAFLLIHIPANSFLPVSRKVYQNPAVHGVWEHAPGNDLPANDRPMDGRAARSAGTQ